MNLIWRFVGDERAATSIEYAMIACGISVVIVAALTAVGTALQNKFYGPLASNLS